MEKSEEKIINQLTSEFNLRSEQVTNTVKLIDDGNTIPFIARYRKEATGSLSDEILRDFYDRLSYLRNLEDKKEEILRLIDEQENLTVEIAKSIENAVTLSELEIYTVRSDQNAAQERLLQKRKDWHRLPKLSLHKIRAII